MRTLLLADDSITIQRVIALTFAEEDFRVIAVSDGQQAIDRIATQRPDVVLAGTTMPGVDGYEVSRFVRSQPALKDVPVLLLTGAFELVDAARVKASGASGVLEKPFEPATVISRVKELLGLKREARPTPAPGRMVTSGDMPREPHDRKPPAPVRPQPASWDELRAETGLEPDARSVEGSAHEAGRKDYLDTLDAAFDSLDQHLSGKPGESRGPHHLTPPPRRNEPVDPRSPGRRPPAQPEGPPANAVFEVDDEWFAADDKADRDRQRERTTLAAEMGIHDVDLPDAGGGAAPLPDLDFDFGIDARLPVAAEVRQQMADEIHEVTVDAMPVAPVSTAHQDLLAEIAEAVADHPPSQAAPVHAAPIPVVIPVTPLAAAPPSAPAAPVAAPAPALAVPIAPTRADVPAVADAFEALLAFEQGEPLPAPPIAVPAPIAPIVIQAPAPEITPAMLDQIAARVADRLAAGVFGDQLRDVMSKTVRDTVQSVVSDTSERLVRDEIARVKAQAEREQ